MKHLVNSDGSGSCACGESLEDHTPTVECTKIMQQALAEAEDVFADADHVHKLFEDFRRSIHHDTDDMIFTSWLSKLSQEDMKRLQEHFTWLLYWTERMIK